MYGLGACIQVRARRIGLLHLLMLLPTRLAVSTRALIEVSIYRETAATAPVLHQHPERQRRTNGLSTTSRLT